MASEVGFKSQQQELTDDTPIAFSPLISIFASGVLGEFSYSVDFGPHQGALQDDGLSDEDDDPRLSIIYAENGSGKTNLMKAVYLLCTPDIDALQGLIDIPILAVKILFESGTYINFERTDSSESFFDLTIGHPLDLEPATLIVRPEDFGSRMYRRALERRSDYTRYLDKLRQLGSFAIFTGDDRLVLSALVLFGGRVLDTSDDRDYDRELYRSGRARASQSSELVDAIDRVERAFRQAAIDGLSDNGPGDAGVYYSIAQTIMRGADEKLESAAARNALLERCNGLLERGNGFEQFGLLNLSQVRAVVAVINSARTNDRHFPQLHSIIAPYLDSVSGRLDSLEDAKRMIETFVESVNGFLTPKSLSFTMSRGIQLRDRKQRLLQLKSLSSGEKHLLILLSNAVLASRTGGLVLIDEPELSLGLSWQRNLLTELLRCVGDSNVQFLVASHSAQIIGNRMRVTGPIEEIA
jgi:hypothetical protein